MAIEPGSTVCAWVSAHHHDQLIALANQREISVSRLVAGLIVRLVTPEIARPVTDPAAPVPREPSP